MLDGNLKVRKLWSEDGRKYLQVHPNIHMPVCVGL